MKNAIKKPLFWIVVVIIIIAIYFAFFNESTKIFSVGGTIGAAPSPSPSPAPGGGGRGRMVVGTGFYPGTTQSPCTLPAACEAWINTPSNNPNNRQLLDECILAMKRLA